MDLRLLGPLELVADGGQVPIGGARQRIVLSVLALNLNRVTSLEHLIDSVWGDSPPATARSQIQICISYLRRIFADLGDSDVIVTRAGGYLLRLGTDQLDVARFTNLTNSARDMVDQGRLSEGIEALRLGLGLWRGRALMGVPGEVVERSATFLEERRMAAVEERYRLELALGRHDKVVGDLMELVDKEPLRERLLACLMLALYRTGRQAEALDSYRRTRAVLVSELGIEPSQELQDLEMAMLNADPQLELGASEGEPDASRVGIHVPGLAGAEGEATSRPGAGSAPRGVPEIPWQLPGDVADFTGRERCVAEIKDYLTAHRDALTGPSSVRIVGITGKGGIGKSALAIRAAHELHDSFPDGQLYADLHTAPGPDGPAQALSAFLRSLGVECRSVPETVTERSAMYRSRLAGKRVLIVLDGAPDERSVQLLLPGTAECAVIVTSRSRLTGLPGAHGVKLDVFDVDLSVELLAKIAGRERFEREPAAAAELADLCAGLPLALRIAGARLAYRPHWEISRLVRRLSDEAARLDELSHSGMELRSTIGLAYRALNKPAQRLFRLFALLRTSVVPGWAAAALLDVRVEEAEEVLEQLVDVQLLDVVSSSRDRHHRYRFHDLIRVYARERLDETESQEEARAALKRVLSAWLLLAEEAHRREYGGDFTILHGSAPRWRLPRTRSRG